MILHLCVSCPIASFLILIATDQQFVHTASEGKVSRRVDQQNGIKDTGRMRD